MNTAHLNALIYTWTHGLRGLALAYGILALFSLAGLKQGRATARQYLVWPITTLPTMVVAGVAAEVMLWALGKFAGITLPNNQLIPALVFYMVAGFLGGLYWASRGRRAGRHRAARGDRVRWAGRAAPDCQAS